MITLAVATVQPGARHLVVAPDAARRPRMSRVESFERHPEFDLETALAHRETPDVALLKLAAPMPSSSPAEMMSDAPKLAPGDFLTVAGYGVTERGNGKSGARDQCNAL